jgi:DNA repair exonuclease SbcCD nuclease subunit
MTKIAILTDTHWGARGDSVVFMEYFNKFYDEVFFPYLEENNITEILHLGDVVEKRKGINFYTARKLRQFVQKCNDRGIKFRGVIGNHDAYYKNTNKVNSIYEIFDDSLLDIEFWHNPKEIEVDGLKIAMIPWICADNYELTMEFIKNTKAQVAMGHLEVAGFAMYKGDTNVDRGINRKTFDKFDIVLSGHYHHKSTDGQLFYLGSPYEIVWSDWNDDRGFHVFDTSSRNLEYIKNPYKMFHKIMWDNGPSDFSEEQITGSYVKVIIQQKDNEEEFEEFFKKIEMLNPTELQVIEDAVDLAVDGEDLDLEVDDTLTIMKKEVDTMVTDVPKNDIIDEISDIYTEAMNIE